MRLTAPAGGLGLSERATRTGTDIRQPEFPGVQAVPATPPDSRIRGRLILATGLVFWLGSAASASIDDFDRLDGPALSAVVDEGGSEAKSTIAIRELAAIRPVLDGVVSPLLIAKTGRGNPARLLLSPALRKPEDGDGAAVPILLIERFDTFEAGPARSRIASGRGVVLFDGDGIDLDTGQIVPEGFGADLRFRAGDGPADGRIDAVVEARLFAPTVSPLAGQPGPVGPSKGRSVAATDFSGRYRLDADGRWVGDLTLEADEAGTLTGRFRSEETGTSYPVRGRVGPDPNRATFGVDLPRARLDFDARLFTEGKRTLAGTVVLEGQVYGFVADRQEAVEADKVSDSGTNRRRIMVYTRPLGYKGRGHW